MTKEEFAAKMSQLNADIRAVEKEKTKLKKEYVENNCPYTVGDKVKILSKSWKGETTVDYGFVERINIDSNGNFLPDCAACKKDGTKHAKNKVYVLAGCLITKV